MTRSQLVRLVPLKRLATIRSSSVDKVVDDNEIPIRLCNYVDVYYNDQIHSALKFAEGSAKQSEIYRFGLKLGDVLITKDSETPADIAVPALVVESADDLVCGYHLALLRSNPTRLNGTFLFYALKSQLVQADFSVRAQGITRFGLTLNGIGSVAIPLPDLPTQKAIVDFLGRETARIDQLIEKKQRMVDLAEERWYTTLDNAICGRSNLALKRRVANANVKEIPEPSIRSPLKHLTDDRRPIMYGIVLPGPNVEDGPMIVKGGDVKPGRLKPERLCRTTFTIERSHTRSRLKAGDLVIAIRGGIGDVEIIPPEIDGANLTQDAARIAPRNDVSNKWLRYALQAPSVFAPLEARALGAAVSGINIFDLKRVQVPTPPLDEQVEIAANLAVEERRINNLTNLLRRYSVVIREFRAALITAAVTGQIDVSTWGKQKMTDRHIARIEEASSA